MLVEVLLSLQQMENDEQEYGVTGCFGSGATCIEYLPVEDTMSIYRAIGEIEFYSVMRTNQFSFWPCSAKVKYFAMDFEETLKFANMAFAMDIAAVLEVKVQKSILELIGDFTHVDTTLFRSGTVEIQPENLDEFNNSIIEIIHRY